MEKFLDRSEMLILISVEHVASKTPSMEKSFSVGSSLSSVNSADFSKSALLGLNVVRSSLLILMLSLNTGDCRWVLKIILNGAMVDK